MARNPNTTTGGGSFDAATVQAVWERGQRVAGQDPSVSRKDACGAWITRSAHGTTGNTGWEVDHIKPVSKGGTDDLTNLQPLQWQNNRHKGDDWPTYSCLIKG
jgi:5-methylcytosine-specific restriction endonuclease McrA